MDKRRFISEAGVKEIIRKKEDGSLTLVGLKCKKCGFISFPAVRTCIRCGSEDMESEELPQKGTLYTWTQTMRPVNHMPAGTITGYVDLTDGVRVYAPLDIEEGDAPRIGAEVQIRYRTLWTEEDGTEVVGYVGRQHMETRMK